VRLTIDSKPKNLIKWLAQQLSLLAMLFLVGCGGSCDDLEMLSAGSQVHPKFSKKAYNKPYQIKGVWYTPQPHYNINEEGIASYYGGTDVFHGRKTSNGEVFDMNEVSAAHKTAPIPCVLLVTNLENGRSLKVKVNDRGPFIDGRIIDVSRRTAQLLGFYRQGTTRVHVKTLMPETMLLVQGHADNVAPDLTQQILLAQNISQKKQQIKASSSKPQAPQNHESILVALKEDIAEFSQEIEHSTDNSQKTNTFAQKVSHNLSQDASPAPIYQKASLKSNNETYRVKPAQQNKNSIANKGVFIQAGTFSHPKHAQQAKVLLQRNLSSIPVRLESVQFSKKQLYRVVVGPCRNNVHARQLAHRIKTIGCSMPRDSIVVFNG
jgi:rare lipoprotein A